MDQQTIINQTADYVKEKLSGEGTGHDWWHTNRVWQVAWRIGREEKVDLFVVQLAALLHDIADWKLYGGDDSVGPQLAREWLKKLDVEKEIINHICEIIKEISFKGAGVKSQIKTKEGMVVQDADRLDAIGAIGIARCFAMGSKFNQPIYDPDIKPVQHQSFTEYKSAKTTSINHFYEKLFLLKDLMNTETAKMIAAERHDFMEEFLAEFLKEWEGKEED